MLILFILHYKKPNKYLKKQIKIGKKKQLKQVSKTKETKKRSNSLGTNKQKNPLTTQHYF